MATAESSPLTVSSDLVLAAFALFAAFVAATRGWPVVAACSLGGGATLAWIELTGYGDQTGGDA